MTTLMAACALFAVAVLLVILGYIAARGVGAVSWEFLTSEPQPVGEGGGIGNGILGTLILILLGSAAGLPLGVAVARSGLMAWPPGAHASTFGGNPVSCAAALATIKLLNDALVRNAADVGAHLMAAVKALMDKHRLIGDVRGRGLMIGVELVRDRKTKERATTERDQVVEAAFRRGLLLLGAGKNAIRFSPPLVLTREQADVALRIFDEALTEVARSI
jgi:4-aminobutyrate aminotransferase